MNNTIPVAISINNPPISTDTVYHIQPTTNDVICRSCGTIFQLPIHMQPTSDQYFRCRSCSGLTKKRICDSFCCLQ